MQRDVRGEEQELDRARAGADLQQLLLLLLAPLIPGLRARRRAMAEQPPQRGAVMLLLLAIGAAAAQADAGVDPHRGAYLRRRGLASSGRLRLGWAAHAAADAWLLDVPAAAQGNPGVARADGAALTAAVFEREFRGRRALILTNDSEWLRSPALWSRAALLRAHGGHVLRHGRSNLIQAAVGQGYLRETLSSFVARAEAEAAASGGGGGGGGGGERDYAFDHGGFLLRSAARALRRSVAVLPYLRAESDGAAAAAGGASGGRGKGRTYFLLGGTRSGVVAHMHGAGWNALLSGAKRWFLWPPNRMPPVALTFGVLHWFEKVYPKLAPSERPIELIQRAGEVIYLPDGWGHATLNVGLTLAVAAQRPSMQDPLPLAIAEVRSLLPRRRYLEAIRKVKNT